MEITIRTATTSETDISFISWGFDAAMLGLFRTMLGPKCQNILSKLNRIPEYDLSYEHVWLAEKKDKIVGMLSGIPTEKMKDIAPIIVKCAGVTTFRFFLYYLLGLPLFNAIKKHSPGEWYLQAVAVSSECRSQGIGKKLIEKGIQLAKQHKCNKIVLDVASINIEGIKLYKCLGFRMSETSAPARMLKGVRIHRMVKDL